MPRPVFYITRILPEYRIPVLEALNEQLEGRLVVGHGRPPEGSSLESLVGDRSSGLNRIQLTNYWFRGETLHGQRYTPIFDAYGLPSVVLAEESPRSLSLPFLLRYAQKQGAGRVLWGHFSSNNRTFSPWHPLDRYRLEVARRVEACVCYSEPIRQTLSELIDDDRLFVARNTVNADQLLELREKLAVRGKETIRRELDLAPDRPVLVFLGRLIPKKEPKLLLEVFQRLRGKRPAQLVVIGEGPERKHLEQRIQNENIPDVRFLGAVTDNEKLAPYLFASDALVIPGYLGLAVNDAFACGLPVVSREAPPNQRFHSPEIAYVKPGENGELASRGGPEAVLSAIETVVESQARYSANALRYARQHLTINHIVDGLAEAISVTERRSG